MLICEGCGGSYDIKSKFCPNCGRAAPEANIRINSALTNQPMLACPKCHKDDNVAKVSAILQRDTHLVQSQVPITTVHTNGSGTVSSDTYWHNVSSTQMSNLAQTLLPPPPPVRNNFGLIWSVIVAGVSAVIVLFCAVWLVVFIAVALVENNATSLAEQGQFFVVIIGMVGLFIFLTICLGGIGYYYVSKDLKYKKDYPSHMKLWEESMRRYDQLCYCFRDDCVFIPNENTSTSPSNMMELIKWHPYSSKPPFRIFHF